MLYSYFSPHAKSWSAQVYPGTPTFSLQPKFMALVLVAAMCMCLFAGCGSSNSGTAATEAPAEASGSNTFKIGGSGPLTGDAPLTNSRTGDSEKMGRMYVHHARQEVR